MLLRIWQAATSHGEPASGVPVPQAATLIDGSL